VTPVLRTLTDLCLALPEATVEQRHSHAAFRVRQKVFAYFLDDHHGDGIVSLCWKAAPGENRERAEAEPKRFYLPAYIGSRGWSAVRLDVGPIDWDEIAELVLASYTAVAPKTLAAQVDPDRRVTRRPGRGRSR
jgi:predicted DNA-binding protein (MmcQ/YjbR family)